MCILLRTVPFNWLSQKLSDTFRNVHLLCNPIPESDWEMGEKEKKKDRQWDEAVEWQREGETSFCEWTRPYHQHHTTHSGKKLAAYKWEDSIRAYFCYTLNNSSHFFGLSVRVWFFTHSVGRTCTLYQIINKSNSIWGCSKHICSFVHAKAIIMNQRSNVHNGYVFDDAKNIDKLFDDWEKME